MRQMWVALGLLVACSVTHTDNQRSRIPQESIAIYFVPFSTDTIKPFTPENIIEQYDMTSLLKRSHDKIKGIIEKASIDAVFNADRTRLRIDGWKAQPVLVDQYGCVLIEGRQARLSDEDFKKLQYQIYVWVPNVAYPY